MPPGSHGSGGAVVPVVSGSTPVSVVEEVPGSVVELTPESVVVVVEVVGPSVEVGSAVVLVFVMPRESDPAVVSVASVEVGALGLVLVEVGSSVELWVALALSLADPEPESPHAASPNAADKAIHLHVLAWCMDRRMRESGENFAGGRGIQGSADRGDPLRYSWADGGREGVLELALGTGSKRQMPARRRRRPGWREARRR